MQFNQVLLLIALTATSAIAAPPRVVRPQAPARPPPPQPPKVSQSISCSSGAPFCCAPATENGGTTCVALTGSSVQCNSIAVCCNNNNGNQACSANLLAPVVFKPTSLGFGSFE